MDGENSSSGKRWPYLSWLPGALSTLLALALAAQTIRAWDLESRLIYVELATAISVLIGAVCIESGLRLLAARLGEAGSQSPSRRLRFILAIIFTGVLSAVSYGAQWLATTDHSVRVIQSDYTGKTTVEFRSPSTPASFTATLGLTPQRGLFGCDVEVLSKAAPPELDFPTPGDYQFVVMARRFRGPEKFRLVCRRAEPRTSVSVGIEITTAPDLVTVLREPYLRTLNRRFLYIGGALWIGGVLVFWLSFWLARSWHSKRIRTDILEK